MFNKHPVRKRKMRKAQAWSSDLLIAGAIFLVGIIIFLYVISGVSTTKSIDALLKDANIISDFVVSTVADPCSFVDDNVLKAPMLAQCAAFTYSQLKTRMRADADFCIHFEDDEGNLINISAITGREGIGIGDSRLGFVLRDGATVVGTQTC